MGTAFIDIRTGKWFDPETMAWDSDEPKPLGPANSPAVMAVANVSFPKGMNGERSPFIHPHTLGAQFDLEAAREKARLTLDYGADYETLARIANLTTLDYHHVCSLVEWHKAGEARQRRLVKLTNPVKIPGRNCIWRFIGKVIRARDVRKDYRQISDDEAMAFLMVGIPIVDLRRYKDVR